MLICPVCRKSLTKQDRRYCCDNGHTFDIAKEGYVNLLRTNKAGDKMGDDKLSARCRRDFLNKGYYASLKKALQEVFREKTGSVLDICCGEGYYTAGLGENPNLQVFGFDLSKEMVRLGAKRGGASYFVANLAQIPVADDAFDYAVHLFAPFQEAEFLRVLKPGGRLYTVIPGSEHLWGLKTAVYDMPYRNDEMLPPAQTLKLVSVQKVSAQITLSSHEDIDAVFRMTPYYFHTSKKDKDKLMLLCHLQTQIEFVIGEYVKM